MTIQELSRAQILELKMAYLTNVRNENRPTTYSELANVDQLVSFEELAEEYGKINFSPDDFMNK